MYRSRCRFCACSSSWFSTSIWPRRRATSDFSCSTWLKSSTSPWLLSCASSAPMRSSSCFWTWDSRWLVCLDPLARLFVVEERGGRLRGGDEGDRGAQQPQRARRDAMRDLPCCPRKAGAHGNSRDAVVRGTTSRGVTRRRRRCRRGGSRPTRFRRGLPCAAFPCRSSPFRSAISEAPRTIISFFTASARFCPSAMLYSRVPRSSVLPCTIDAQAPVRLQVLGVRFDHRLVLVLDHELVVVEIDAALGENALRILVRGRRRPRGRAAHARGGGAAVVAPASWRRCPVPARQGDVPRPGPRPAYRCWSSRRAPPPRMPR